MEMETSLKVLSWTFWEVFFINHRTDLGKDFIKSGMTLITDPRSDRYLRKIEKRDEKVENEGVSKKASK